MFGDKPVPYEVALALAGHGRMQRWVTFAGAMCLLCSYLGVSMVSFVLPLSQCDLQLTSQGKGAIIASGFVGIIISSHLWGFLSDTLGRRYILARCLFADGLLYIITSFVPNYWVFLVMRFFNGCSSCGSVVSAWAYIGEFHTDKNRTRSIMTASVVATVIYFILPCLAWIICPLPVEVPLFSGFIYRSWRLFYTLCGIPSLLTALLMTLLPESPKFLLAQGEKQKAIKVLQYVYSENTGKPAEDLVFTDVYINEKEKITQLKGNPKGLSAFFYRMYNQTAPLFKKPLNFNLTLLCTMQFILYFCNNGMFLWIPETINRLAEFRANNPNMPGTFCQANENFRTIRSHGLVNKKHMSSFSYNHNGITGHTFSGNASVYHLTKCKDTVDFSVYINTSILGLGTGLGLIVIIILMKLFSRKYVLGGFLLCSVLATVGVFLVNHTSFVFCIICIMIVLTGSGIPIVTSIVVDVFPTNLRAMAVCLSLLSGRFGTIVSSQMVGTVIDTHCNIIVYTFIVMLLICTILVGFLPDTSTPTADKEITKKKQDNETTMQNQV